MKLVTLNIWGGHLYEPLLDFFEHNREVDIFCLQEVYCQANKPATTRPRIEKRVMRNMGLVMALWRLEEKSVRRAVMVPLPRYSRAPAIVPAIDGRLDRVNEKYASAL